jgi:hypothetical protein
VQPDKAAVVIVGDGAEVIDQIKPFTETLELYNTAGKKKDDLASASANGASDVFGNWALEIETPLGQSIPATMTLTQTEAGPSARIDSEMGSGDLGAIEIGGRALSASVSFDMDGQMLQGQVSGTFQGGRLNGTLTLQGFPSLTFTGYKSS